MMEDLDDTLFRSMTQAGGASIDRIKSLMQLVQETSNKIAEAKRVEKARSRASWLKIKDAIREADSEYLGYLRDWDRAKRHVDNTYESYKQARLRRKRLDCEIKLAKAKLKAIPRN